MIVKLISNLEIKNYLCKHHIQLLIMDINKVIVLKKNYLNKYILIKFTKIIYLQNSNTFSKNNKIFNFIIFKNYNHHVIILKIEIKVGVKICLVK